MKTSIKMDKLTELTVYYPYQWIQIQNWVWNF